MIHVYPFLFSDLMTLLHINQSQGEASEHVHSYAPLSDFRVNIIG